MKSKLILAGLTLATVFFISCKDPLETECDIEAPAPALEINVPDTLSLTSTIPMKVQISNGCGNYLRLKTERDLNVLFVYPIARYQGCICTQVIKEQQVNATLTFPQTGSFTLQVLTTQGDFITKRVFVR
jgi:hypothetical protein